MVKKLFKNALNNNVKDAKSVNLSGAYNYEYTHNNIGAQIGDGNAESNHYRNDGLKGIGSIKKIIDDIKIQLPSNYLPNADDSHYVLATRDQALNFDPLIQNFQVIGKVYSFNASGASSISLFSHIYRDENEEQSMVQRDIRRSITQYLSCNHNGVDNHVDTLLGTFNDIIDRINNRKHYVLTNSRYINEIGNNAANRDPYNNSNFADVGTHMVIKSLRSIYGNYVSFTNKYPKYLSTSVIQHPDVMNMHVLQCAQFFNLIYAVLHCVKSAIKSMKLRIMKSGILNPFELSIVQDRNVRLVIQQGIDVLTNLINNCGIINTNVINHINNHMNVEKLIDGSIYDVDNALFAKYYNILVNSYAGDDVNNHANRHYPSFRPSSSTNPITWLNFDVTNRLLTSLNGNQELEIPTISPYSITPFMFKLLFSTVMVRDINDMITQLGGNISFVNRLFIQNDVFKDTIFSSIKIDDFNIETTQYEKDVKPYDWSDSFTPWNDNGDYQLGLGVGLNQITRHPNIRSHHRSAYLLGNKFLTRIGNLRYIVNTGQAEQSLATDLHSFWFYDTTITPVINNFGAGNINHSTELDGVFRVNTNNTTFTEGVNQVIGYGPTFGFWSRYDNNLLSTILKFRNARYNITYAIDAANNHNNYGYCNMLLSIGATRAGYLFNNQYWNVFVNNEPVSSFEYPFIRVDYESYDDDVLLYNSDIINTGAESEYTDYVALHFKKSTDEVLSEKIMLDNSDNTKQPTSSNTSSSIAGDNNDDQEAESKVGEKINGIDNK